MKKELIKERIEKIEEQRFYLSCKDHWNSSDYAKDDEMLKEIRELTKMLKMEA